MGSDIEDVLAALGAAQVRYLVVGGVAVVLHGQLRTTADLDLVVQLNADNVERAVTALEGLGYRPRAPVPAKSLADPAIRKSWVEDKGLTVFSMWSSKRPTLEVDIFVEEPFDFDGAYQRGVRVLLDGTEAMVVSLEDLLSLKEQAGRPQDIADVEALRSIAQAQKDTSDEE